MSLAEEILFVGSLRSCTTEVEIERKVFFERQRRLQRPALCSSYDEFPQIAFVARQPQHPETPRIADLTPASAGLLAQLVRDMPDYQFRVQKISPETDRRTLGQAELETWERLFPLFLRLLLEGRFSHLCGKLLKGQGISGNHVPQGIEKQGF
jgi:hypothetical protein